MTVPLLMQGVNNTPEVKEVSSIGKNTRVADPGVSVGSRSVFENLDPDPYPEQRQIRIWSVHPDFNIKCEFGSGYFSEGPIWIRVFLPDPGEVDLDQDPQPLKMQQSANILCLSDFLKISRP